ncbi:hypothetical protein RHGRI_020602 [Rhododendron griersonianum]|uniref:Uncharacterized protein n=1 Tax=Rhododendron griersonianum TaxID=479676 RepID=A0AAV6JH12_9ERIC|nr:hypothetical protein RHGRI_020602 [Rhododendron griersonianum]
MEEEESFRTVISTIRVPDYVVNSEPDKEDDEVDNEDDDKDASKEKEDKLVDDMEKHRVKNSDDRAKNNKEEAEKMKEHGFNGRHQSGLENEPAHEKQAVQGDMPIGIPITVESSTEESSNSAHGLVSFVQDSQSPINEECLDYANSRGQDQNAEIRLGDKHEQGEDSENAANFQMQCDSNIRAIPLNRDLWTDGYFSDVAKLVGGVWLRVWIQVAAAMATIGMFEAEMSGDSFQLLGMAERGMLPAFFAKRSRYGTPLVGILFSASGVILLSWLSFEEIVAAENFLYCFGMVLEFIAFIRLRIKYPAASRPFKILVGTVGSILLCIPPTISIGAVLAFSLLKVAVISLVAVVIGLVMQPCLKHVEKKKWLKFSENSDLPADPLRGAAHETTGTLFH